MLPEKSTYTCAIHWQGDNENYESFPRVHRIAFPGGREVVSAGATLIQDPAQTNPEELFAAAVGSCMMMTILAVFSRSRIPVVSYDDRPEALLELVERRFRVTKVTLRPRIVLKGTFDREKLENLILKSHANCFISLSVNSDVVVEPEFIMD